MEENDTYIHGPLEIVHVNFADHVRLANYWLQRKWWSITGEET